MNREDRASRLWGLRGKLTYGERLTLKLVDHSVHCCIIGFGHPSFACWVISSEHEVHNMLPAGNSNPSNFTFKPILIAALQEIASFDARDLDLRWDCCKNPFKLARGRWAVTHDLACHHVKAALICRIPHIQSGIREHKRVILVWPLFLQNYPPKSLSQFTLWHITEACAPTAEDIHPQVLMLP